MTSETVYVIKRFFSNPKQDFFLRFLSCCTRFFEAGPPVTAL